MIKEANVTLMVGDMKKSLQFYTKVLGFKVKAAYGEEFAQVDARGTIIALHPARKGSPKARSSGPMSIGFAVDDLDKTVAQLKKKGVAFSRVSDDGPVALAFFADPDGFPLYLSKSKWG